MSEERVSLRFDSFRSFLDACSAQVSEEGIFLATDAVRPVGSRVEFDLGLGDDFPLLRGTGEVVWVVEPNGEGSVPGMAVRYESTDSATATLAEKIAARQRSLTGATFELASAAEAEPRSDADSSAFATQALDAALLAEAEGEDDAAEATPAAGGADTEVLRIDDEEAAAVMPPYLEAAVAGSQKSSGGRSGLWVTLILIAGLTGVVFWQRDFLAEKLRGVGSPATEPAAEASEMVVPEPETTDVVEPIVQTAAEPETSVPSEPAAVEPAAPSGPLSRIETVRWNATGGATVLELVADGTFPADIGAGGSIERLEDPPRLLLKIAGVTEPLASPTLAVGSEEVVGVRTALHGSPPDSALHVVVDLADPTAQLSGASAEGGVLQVRIASGAVSP